jgi:hypothetical protein
VDPSAKSSESFEFAESSKRIKRLKKAQPADQSVEAELEVEDQPHPEEIRDRLRRRAAFLRELAEARELRRRVAPRRSRRAAIHATLRRRTFWLH